MKIYWTTKSIPELAHLSKKQRRRVWQKCFWQGVVPWRNLLPFGLWLVVVGLIGVIEEQVFQSIIVPALNAGKAKLPWLLRELLRVIRSAAIGVTIYVPWYFFIEKLRPCFRRELGVETCRECGYLLTGLREPRCPECGTAFDPALLEKISPNAGDAAHDTPAKS